MKKIFSFVSAILLTGTMCAQTITIDGDNADWAEVPMLTEPGVGPVVKMVVPQEGITLAEGTAFALMVEGDHELILAGYPVIFTDADKSTTTGGAAWYCPSFGKDYELATWDEGSLFGPLEEMNVREMSINQAAFTGIPFTGSVSAFVAFKISISLKKEEIISLPMYALRMSETLKSTWNALCRVLSSLLVQQ